MRFTFESHSLTLDLEDVQDWVSPHSGNTLRRASVQIRTIGHDRELLDRLLNGGLLTDEGGGEWVARQRESSWSRSGSDITTHRLRIEQTENRKASEIEFCGMSFTPERYREETQSNDELEIRARIVAGGEDADRIKRVVLRDEDVELRRRGVNEAPILVAVELLGWSQPGEGPAVFDLEFNQATVRPKRGLHPPLPGPFAELDHIRENANAGFGGVLMILEALQEKGLFSEQEIQGLRRRIAHEADMRYLEMRRREDVRVIPFDDTAVSPALNVATTTA